MNTPMISDFEKGTDHLDGLVVKNPVEETKKAIKELEGKVDVMVGVMHMGLENENGIRVLVFKILRMLVRTKRYFCSSYA